MITNLIILDREGNTVLSHAFGACNSLGDNPDTVSGFLSAVHSFSMMLSGNHVSEIRLGSRCFFLTVDKLILVLVSDDHNDEANRHTLQLVRKLFMKRFAHDIDAYLIDHDTSRFTSLPSILIDEGLVQANCGGMSDCSDCGDNGKNFPVESVRQMLHEKMNMMKG